MFIPVTGFQCHSVPVNSGDCSGEITGISKFRGRSEILAGKFHWNGTGIRQNAQNPAGICRASATAATPKCVRLPTQSSISQSQMGRRTWSAQFSATKKSSSTTCLISSCSSENFLRTWLREKKRTSTPSKNNSCTFYLVIFNHSIHVLSLFS